MKKHKEHFLFQLKKTDEVENIDKLSVIKEYLLYFCIFRQHWLLKKSVR